MPKGIFLDLDGTLLKSNKTITPRAEKIIKKFTKKGDYVFLETGKSFLSSVNYHRQLELKTPLITSQGQVVSFFKRNAYDHHIKPMNIDHLKYIIRDYLFQGKIINVLVDAFDVVYAEHKLGNLFDLIDEEHIEVKKLNYDDLSDMKKIIACFVEIRPMPIKKLIQFTKILNEVFHKDYVFSFWMTDGNLPIISIKPYGIDKWKAVEIAKKEYPDMDQIISFGNGFNDKQMLEKADLSFAMSNSNKAIKKFATYVTILDNNNDGVADELEKLYEQFYGEKIVPNTVVVKKKNKLVRKPAKKKIVKKSIQEKK